MKHVITLRVNGDCYSLAVDPWRTLNELLRQDLNLTGTKLGCRTGDCGAWIGLAIWLLPPELAG